MEQSDQRLIDLGILKFIKKPEDYFIVMYQAKEILSLIEIYHQALMNRDDSLRKEILNKLLDRYQQQLFLHRSVAEFLTEKLIGKDYIGLYYMKQHGEI